MLLLSTEPEIALIDLINEVNNLDVPLVPGGLYYGKPKAAANGMTTLNTTTNYDNFDYEGYAQFTYKRVSLTKVFGETRPVLPTTKVDDVHGLLPLINKRVGLNLLPKDIFNSPLTWGAIDSRQSIEITAETDSLGYEGKFTIQFILKRYSLPEVVKVSVLDVLTHPDPVDPKKRSLTMSTWGLDFTDLFDPNTVLKGGAWADIVLIADLMDSLGFPNFPQAKGGTLSIRKTSDFPQANHEYSHFIFQGPVDTETYQGNAYIHFNM